MSYAIKMIFLPKVDHYTENFDLALSSFQYNKYTPQLFILGFLIALQSCGSQITSNMAVC